MMVEKGNYYFTKRNDQIEELEEKVEEYKEKIEEYEQLMRMWEFGIEIDEDKIVKEVEILLNIDLLVFE